jgi:hypothetical protein
MLMYRYEYKAGALRWMHDIGRMDVTCTLVLFYLFIIDDDAVITCTI